jgi:carboxylesterase type B
MNLSSQRMPALDLSPIVGESWRKGDDYLTLNIWTPDPGTQRPQGLVGEDPPFELARRVHQTWITFAATGDPGWAPFGIQQRKVMRINTAWEILNDPRSIERHAWDGVR